MLWKRKSASGSPEKTSYLAAKALDREHARSQSKTQFQLKFLHFEYFRQLSRKFNSVLSFSSFEVDKHVPIPGRGPPWFKIQGQIYHRVGPLLPAEGRKPVFAQMYFYDTEHE